MSFFSSKLATVGYNATEYNEYINTVINLKGNIPVSTITPSAFLVEGKRSEPERLSRVIEYTGELTELETKAQLAGYIRFKKVDELTIIDNKGPSLSEFFTRSMPDPDKSKVLIDVANQLDAESKAAGLSKSEFLEKLGLSLSSKPLERCKTQGKTYEF